MATILITGGAGFIGSNLCAKLLQLGHKVICLDSLITGKKENIQLFSGNKNFQFILSDIVKPIPISKLKFKKIEQIYNLASPASPVDYQERPLETLLSGSAGVQNLLELAKKNKARFLQSSTSEVYGDPLVHPQRESYFGNVNCYGPRACYDESKRFGEALIYTYRRKYKVNTAIVRIFNTFGEKMRPDDGRVVSNFIVQALQNKPLTIYGDGHQTRSFCYIDDMVEGLVKMMESAEEGPINLGNPQEFKIIDLAQKILKLTGSKSKLIYKPLPKDDPKQRKPDITLAKTKLNWQPKISLDEGLKKTIEWFKSLH